MKQTMKYLSIAALVVVGANMMSCNKVELSTEQLQEDKTTSNVVTLTTTVGLDGGATTRALTSGGVKTFAAGETIALVYKKTGGATAVAVSDALKDDGDIASGAKSATFTFTLEDPDNTQNVTYVYPAAMAKADGYIDYDALNTQDGTLTSLASNLDLATYTAAWNGTALPNVTLDNQLAILALTLKDNATPTANDITSTITGVAVSDGTKTYTVTRSAAAGPIYVAIQPTSSADIEVTATDGTKNYTKSLTGKTYEAGNGYSVSWRMAEAAYTLLSAASTTDYGKVVCAAGHLHDAKTAVPSWCTAVGILGKVTETGHGLILALQDATSQTWNTIDGWASVTTYAGGTRLKVLPDDAARGSLTSYTTLGETTVSNWAVAQKSDYEAIFTNLGSGRYDKDGYTYDANVNAYITTGVGGAALSGYYWSATWKTDYRSWYFYENFWVFDPNGTLYRVRPVLGF